MRTLKLTIAYDGTRYAGWQRQKNGARGKGKGAREQRTIQGELEQALSIVLRERVVVVGSGRTDAGVHAEGQVAHVKEPGSFLEPGSLAAVVRSVNAMLPGDIAVLRMERAPAAFHARFDARRKRYRYRIFTGPVVPPFIRPYVHQVRTRLDVAAMRREAVALIGRHDVRAFARAGRRRSSVRRIFSARLARRGPELILDVEGEGFLHRMVRSIAGTLLDVGRGRLPRGTVRRMLRTGRRVLAGTTAPACGLCLVGVTYAARRGRVSSGARSST